MNLETLKLYCDIVRLHSFSQGAALNQVSQSAASQAVQQLEAELDVQLIDRSKRPFMLTPEGQRFFQGSQELLQRFTEVQNSIASARTQMTGIVRIAAIYSVGIHIISDHTQRFMAAYPQARVRLEYLHPQKVVDAVLTDEADLGILSYPPANRSLTVLPWRSEVMVFVCHPAHRLARRKTIAPRDLDDEPFVAFDSDLRIRKAIDRYLRQHQGHPKMVMEFDNIETIKQAIAVAAGVSILPQATVIKEVGNRTLTALPLTAADLVRPLGIIHRRGKTLTPTIRRFLDQLRTSNPSPPIQGTTHKR
jgi:DNA-binding transcriptional LysR family regulator